MTVNKIFVTFGIVTHSEELGETTSFMELPFDVPEGAVISYMGLEIEDKENPRTGRATIVRTPFHLDGEQIKPMIEYRISYIDGETGVQDEPDYIDGESSDDGINRIETRRIVILEEWRILK